MHNDINDVIMQLHDLQLYCSAAGMMLGPMAQRVHRGLRMIFGNSDGAPTTVDTLYQDLER
jgi:hypothetical protein